MAFAEVTVIVDGVLERSDIFTSQKGVDNYVAVAEAEAQLDGLPTMVFVLWHEHDVTQTECTCSQFTQDGRPTHEWNT
jgi:hypothetical protein